MAKSLLCVGTGIFGIACCIGCGGDDHPPLLTDDQTYVGSKPDGVDPEGFGGDSGGQAGSSGSQSAGGSSGTAFSFSACGEMVPFDPAEVYVRGPLEGDSSTGYGIALVSDPNAALTGFGTFMYDEVIRPSDGSLLFADPQGVYVFTADACVTATPETYVVKPLDNDAELSGPPGCEADGFRLAPNGTLLYECHDNWMTESGQTVDRQNFPLAFDGERILTEAGVFDIATQTLHAFVGLPQIGDIVAQRVQDNGFWMATSAQDGTHATRWLVDAAGNLQSEGDYPAPPDTQHQMYAHSLAGDGALIQIGSQLPGSGGDNVIIRRTLEGESATIYNQSTDPLVKVSYPALVTGP